MSFSDSSVGKESACNAEDPGLTPRLGRSAGEGIDCTPLRLPLWVSRERITCNTGDLDLIPVLGRSPGEGKGYPLQHSCLESSMDCVLRGFTKSQTQLSSFDFRFVVFDFSCQNGACNTLKRIFMRIIDTVCNIPENNRCAINRSY